MNLTGVRLGGRPDLPLLVLGPSLGTSVTELWSEAARLLAEEFQVIGWDLPGHGTNRIPLDPDGEPLTVAALAAAVVDLVDQMAPVMPGARPTRFHYAGDSVGGAVGLHLLLDAPDRVATATLLCTGARLGSPESWQERIDLVRSGGTAALLELSTQRWFAPGFVTRRPETASALLDHLRGVDDEGYAAVCGAIAGHDVRDRLGQVAAPVLAVAGAHDVATPPDLLRELADGVRDGRLVVLDGVAHLPPAEAPEQVARLFREHALGPVPVDEPAGERNEHGQPVGATVAGWTARPRLGGTVLRGRWVTAEPIADEHTEPLYAAVCGPGDEPLWTYRPAPFPTGREQFQQEVVRRLADHPDSATYVFVPHDGPRGGRAAGLATFFPCSPAAGTVEISGVLFGRALQRTTAATEAIHLLLRHAFDDRGYRRVEWKCDSRNEPSRRAAARLGFSHEGRFRQHMVVKGRNRDTDWFSMLDGEWPQIRARHQRWLSPDNFGPGGRQLSRLEDL
ncbi:alpha/beta fold hydrolase [Nocardioides ferulae]|uniref:alpha/beta fold hydrolase n=1 Tax=Nocardioides ferulae TaxID=2340821 RepID=UPI001F0CAB42|nr:alpha/beta fold hydrolase [Nocardioides ferulae]